MWGKGHAVYVGDRNTRQMCFPRSELYGCGGTVEPGDTQDSFFFTRTVAFSFGSGFCHLTRHTGFSALGARPRTGLACFLRGPTKLLGIWTNEEQDIRLSRVGRGGVEQGEVLFRRTDLMCGGIKRRAVRIISMLASIQKSPAWKTHSF